MGKELIFKTMRHEPTERVPWVPFSGIHSGKLKGFTADEILTDGQKLYESLMEVARLYGPDGMPIMFDLQLEAEILGCELMWARDNPPSVATHPFEGDNKGIPCKCRMPGPDSGRIPVMLDAMRKLKASVGEEIALYGLICGPFTLASHLRGSEIFLDMLMDEQYVRDLVGYCAEVAIRMADYYLGAGMDIIAVVDPLVSQIAPESFDAMLADSFKAVFDFIRSKGAFSSFFVCGNATSQLEVMCRTCPDSVAVDENVDMIYGKSVTDKYNLAISGNIPLTTVMLHGSPKDNMKYVVDLLDKLPDYGRLERPFLEVFTLDSVQCAACTYMMAAAQAAKDYFGDKIDIIEYRYTLRENVVRCKKMGVTNLPTMCINGEIKHVSMIPDSEALRAEIEALL